MDVRSSLEDSVLRTLPSHSEENYRSQIKCFVVGCSMLTMSKLSEPAERP
jgi:hypothetical protein